jgi:hypothetical protein
MEATKWKKLEMFKFICDLQRMTRIVDRIVDAHLHAECSTGGVIRHIVKHQYATQSCLRQWKHGGAAGQQNCLNLSVKKVVW